MKTVIWFVIAGIFFVGCSIEEEQSSGALSLNPNYGEAPEGVSIYDVDHIKDGIIDIKDLVAVAYYHGQEVPTSNNQDYPDQNFDAGTNSRYTYGLFEGMYAFHTEDYQNSFTANSNLRCDYQKRPKDSDYKVGKIAIRFQVNSENNIMNVTLKIPSSTEELCSISLC